jgi:5-methylcytosine-specific restriction endonuclease McrA
MSGARLDNLSRVASMLERQTWELFWGTVAECSSVLKEIAPTRRRLWLTPVILEIHAAQDGLCALCRAPLSPNEWEIDHRIPFCYGGGNEPTNLQIAHITCNRRKGRQVDPMDLLRYLEGRYQNR